MSEKGKSLLQETENLHAKVQGLKLASKTHLQPTDRRLQMSAFIAVAVLPSPPSPR